VLGVESNADAVADAMQNARINNVKNAKFINADAGEFMADLARKGESADVVITDPPRAGCSKKFLESLLALSPKTIVYVSCNPETLSRDLFALRKGGYKVKRIQPVDMFPFTEHIETVVKLCK
jgi:23S rRNA (uracil1939-C5)-methyltransferase